MRHFWSPWIQGSGMDWSGMLSWQRLPWVIVNRGSEVGREGVWWVVIACRWSITRCSLLTVYESMGRVPFTLQWDWGNPRYDFTRNKMVGYVGAFDENRLPLIVYPWKTMKGHKCLVWIHTLDQETTEAWGATLWFKRYLQTQIWPCR